MLSPQIGSSDVSRETLDRLNHYVDLVEKWNPKINLVSRDSLKEIWTRHILDSVQLFTHGPRSAATWVDLRSGGGFPGLVVAVMSAEHLPHRVIHLVESDRRKCVFLRTAARELGLSVTVHDARAEAIPALEADVVSARALAPLDKLLPLAKIHLGAGGIALFPKGARWKKEVEDARRSWSFSCAAHKSETDENAVILQIGEISHV